VPYETPDASTACTADTAVGLTLLPTSPPTNVTLTWLVLPAPQIELALPDVSTPYAAPNASVVIEPSSGVIPLVPANWTDTESDVGTAYTVEAVKTLLSAYVLVRPAKPSVQRAVAPTPPGGTTDGITL
jgi:hypothetical protein